MESARSTPCQSGRHSSRTIAEPAMAASTCSQAPCAAQIVAMASIGSKAVHVVEPDVATTAHGVQPRARSSRIASARASGRIA
jgi:hypothetical protein